MFTPQPLVLWAPMMNPSLQTWFSCLLRLEASAFERKGALPNHHSASICFARTALILQSNGVALVQFPFPSRNGSASLNSTRDVISLLIYSLKEKKKKKKLLWWSWWTKATFKYLKSSPPSQPIKPPSQPNSQITRQPPTQAAKQIASQITSLPAPPSASQAGSQPNQPATTHPASQIAS